MALGGLEDYDPVRVRTLQHRVRPKLGFDSIAVACGVTVGTARGWISGDLIPTPAKAARLAEVLGVKIVDLTSGDPDKPTLIQMRQWRGWTGEDVAQRAGISTNIIWTAERYVSAPQPHTIQALATAYDTTPDQIEEAWNRGRRRKFGALAP